MRLTDLFIHRAVLSGVVSILVLVFGVCAERALPVEEFPHTVSGVIEIQTSYYGADPGTIAGFVTTPLESKISQTQGIDYMTSTSTSGLSDITVYLKLNEDPSRALAEIQSEVTAATARFPAGVQASSISLSGSGGRIMGLAVDSDALSTGQISDYVQRILTPRLQAIAGVQSVSINGAPNVVMRIWLDPERLAGFGLTPSDVFTALANNNLVTGAGSTLGSTVTVNLGINSSLHTADQFRDLVLRQSNLHVTRLRDVARVELGRDPDDFTLVSNDRLGVFVNVNAAPSANALAMSRDLHVQITLLRRQLPPALRLTVIDDIGDFIRISIRDVVVALAESLGIVALVVFAFLGSPRSVLIPLVTIPLSLIGTFTIMAALGFSINLLTLLALVLAIGLVVDDAIIVVEDVNRHLQRGMQPIAAASAAARELFQPILAMTAVLITVYLPLGFQGGLTGALFTEFAFTLAGATVMSAMLALTLSPMMCSRLLRSHDAPGRRSTQTGRMELASRQVLDAAGRAYGAMLRVSLDLQPLTLLLGLLVSVAAFAFYGHSTHELSPREDTGTLSVTGSGAPDTTLDALTQYDPAIIAAYKSIPEARNFFLLSQPPEVDGELVLRDWSTRSRSSLAVGDELQAKLQDLPGLEMAVFSQPYLPGSYGLPIGFVLQSTGTFEQLDQVSDAFVARARASGRFAYIDKDLKIDQPQSTVVVDRAKLSLFDLTMSDVGNSLNAMLGGNFTGFFSADQHSYKVEPLAMRKFRLNTDQILDYPIKSVNGASVPLRSVAHISNSVAPESINHFQQLDATTISALPAHGVTQGQAYDYLRNLAAQTLPAGYGTDTSGPLRQYVGETGGFAATFALAAVITFLALAALFESFRDPLIVMVTVPMSVAGALLFVWLGVGGASLNLFTEVGLVTLMGLISKHGILIVEVANEQQKLGLSKLEAIERACALRLRPILMTTAAMVLGVMPLLFATGAGAASRFVMGLVIASGLSVGTLFTLFVLPAVYMLLAASHAETPAKLVQAPARAARSHAD